MFINEYIEKMRNVQELLLRYLESDDSDGQSYENLNMIKDLEINQDKYDFKLFLHLVSQISANHHRCNNFFEKIETILNNYEEDLKKYFSEIDIFNIFRNNKRILLFLFEEKIIIPNDLIYGMITSNKYKKRNYPEYFYPEFKSFYPQNYIKKLISENSELEDQNYSIFESKRKSGENDSYICQLIRNDSVKEFIVHVNKTNLQLTNIISPSIYETNPYFLKNQATLIDYASFYGSIQIFNYLKMNNVALTEDLWMTSIHSKNGELIHLLEENHIQPIRYKNDGERVCFFLSKSIKNNKDCISESIKCHHIEITNYLKTNLSNFDGENECLRYYNFIDMEYNDNFSLFCKYDYIQFVIFLLKNPIDYNIFDLLNTVKKGNIEIFKLLIENKKFDFNSKLIFYNIF